MITNLLKTVGVVASFMVLAAMTIVAMYLSYIMGIGILLLLVGFVIYQVLTAIPSK